MKKLLMPVLLFSVACYSSQQSACGDGAAPTPLPIPVEIVLPSPSPSPSAGTTPDPCVIKAVRVSFKGGSDSQVPSIALGASVQLDATPMNDSGVIADGCNAVREPLWAVLTPTTCQISGGGYNPFLKGLRVGACTVTATVSNVVSSPFSVEVR